MLWKNSRIHPKFHSKDIYFGETDHRALPYADVTQGSFSNNEQGATEILDPEITIPG